MIFKPVLVDQVRRGHKTVTRRRITHRNGHALRYVAGKEYALQPGRGQPHVGHLLVTATREEPLAAMTVDDAAAEGFMRYPGVGDLLAFWDYWGALHGDYYTTEIVAVIEFRYVGRRECCAPFDEAEFREALESAAH